MASGETHVSEELNGAGEQIQSRGPVDDVYLDALLSFLDQDEAKETSVTVTLLVGGTLVCGELIGHDRWQDELQAMLDGIGGSVELLGKLFKAVDESGEPQPDGVPLYFVHLRNVLIITNYRGTLQGDVPQGIEHPLWRGRLSDVQGWTLGRPS